MREVLKGLTTAYLLVAGAFGGAVVLGSASEIVRLANGAGSEGITIPIRPFFVPLRGSQPDRTPVELIPATPQPHIVPPQKTKTPLDTQFAKDEPATSPAPSLRKGIEKKDRPPISRPEQLPADAETVTITLKADWPAPVKPDPVARLAERVRAGLSLELYENFDLVLYVSKAERGPLAQHMYVFAKESGRQSGKQLHLLESWPVSTGREAMEVAKNGVRMSTETPTGFYQLAPDRFYRAYRSRQWEREMPNSMFFNWMVQGRQTGLAIHGVADSGQIASIGRRASAGCVQLPPGAAEKLFNLVRDNYRGLVPRFAYDEETGTTSNQGKLARDKKGALRMANGYRVLVFIENYGGGEELMTELYVDSSDPAG